MWGPGTAVVTEYLIRENWCPGNGRIFTGAHFLVDGKIDHSVDYLFGWALDTTFTINDPWMPAPIVDATLAQVMRVSFGFDVEERPDSFGPDEDFGVPAIAAAAAAAV